MPKVPTSWKEERIVFCESSQAPSKSAAMATICKDGLKRRAECSRGKYHEASPHGWQIAALRISSPVSAMNASLRTLRPARARNDAFRILAMSLGIFGLFSFSVSDWNSAAAWIFRIVMFGAAATLYWVSRNSSDVSKDYSPQFHDGVLVLSGQRIDPRTITAATVCRYDQGGIVHLWQGEEQAIVTADAKMLAILCGALLPSLLEAPRSYHPSGIIQSVAKLDVDREGLVFPTQWVRGEGMKTERLAWKEIDRVYAQNEFLLIRRKDGQLVGTGVSVARDLEEITIEGIENMRRRKSENPLPEQALVALPRLAAAKPARDTAPYRDAPEISDADLLGVLARGPVESRRLAIEVLVTRGTISNGAALFIQRGLDMKR